MGYCALLIPQLPKKKKEKDQGMFENIKGKLMSGVKEGGLNIENATTVMSNAADLVTDNFTDIATKFSGIGLTQLLTQGKITNDTAFGYLTQGLPKALGLTGIAAGFQDIEQFKTALKTGNGINVGSIFSALTNFGGELNDMFGFIDTKKDVEGFDIIELDAVLDDSRDYSSETPDRRVESGQTYQEFIHNMPDIITLQCVLQDGRRYTGDEFEDILLNLRNRKIAINVILGDVTKESYVLTNFAPVREAMGGYNYSLEFKKIQVGNVELVSLNISSLLKTTATSVVNNALNPEDTKTVNEVSNGYAKALDETKEAAKSALSGIWAGIKMGWK